MMHLLTLIAFPEHQFLAQIQMPFAPRIGEKLAVTRFPSNGDELVTYNFYIRSITHAIKLDVQIKTDVYVEFLDGGYVPEEWA